MKIVILTGGTGSIALQRGLYHKLEKELDGVEIKVLVNAYDNGLSTGIVRRVLHGQILGPSDVRKNQTTRLALKDPSDPWLTFLGCRFTANASSAYERCREEVNQLTKKLQQQDRRIDCGRVLLAAIEEFFRAPMAATIRYDDFSLANIIYAGLAKANGNSLRAAASIMAAALDVPDNVILNDDKSLFLGAITRSGKRITDEGEIVAWGNVNDPFVDLFFVDAEGNASRPELCLEAWRALIEANLVILSAGTQWSSLIPSYASRGFNAAIRSSSAKVLMVMNRAPDKDSPGQTASDIVNILVPRYFDEGRLHVLTDSSGHPNMRRLDSIASAKVASTLETDLATRADPLDKHNPMMLCDAVGRLFFKEYLDSDFLLFDYDDTLVGRNFSYPKSSRFNVSGLSFLHSRTDVGICTGNSIDALQLRAEAGAADAIPQPAPKPILVFADGGVNAYSYSIEPSGNDSRCARAMCCVSAEAVLPRVGPHSASDIIESLQRAGIPVSNIHNRGGVLIAIRPVEKEYRHAVMSLARSIVEGSGLEVRESGRTTVEIYKPTLSKLSAIKHLYQEYSSSLQITYVGDECKSGNDRDIEEFASAASRIRCLHVGSPAMTAFFIATLITRFENHVGH